MKKLYTFNLEMQRVQKKMNMFFLRWTEYQHYKLRYYYYFLYQIYSLDLYDGKHERTIYQYINKDICQEYNNILQTIIRKFNKTESMTSDEKQYITYLNVYHYFSIMKLQKFFSFIMDNMNGKIIDIQRSKGDVY